MHRVTPKVFLVGETTFEEEGLHAYFKHVGAPSWLNDWIEREHDGPLLSRVFPEPSQAEGLIEIMGRLCYRAWAPGFNPNVTKVRKGNDVYIANLVKSKHGSVLEHSVTNWIIADCSRVFTHELVRHRVGTAFSQESLRYVRLEDLGLWLPPEIEAEPEIARLFEQTFESLGHLQIELAKMLKLDGRPFEEKKKLTSAMRRVAPDGLATTIGFSANFRALRHIGEMRTAGAAEAEIQLVVDQIMTIAKKRWPNIFADFERSVDGCWIPAYSKV